MNVSELAHLGIFSFPAVDDIYYQGGTWEDVEDRTLFVSNMDFFPTLKQESLPATLHAYYFASQAHAEDFDIWTLFCCYQYIVYGNLGNWTKEEMLRQAKQLMWHSEKEIAALASEADREAYQWDNEYYEQLGSQDETQIVYAILSHIIESVNAKPYFSLSTDLKMEHCVLCRNEHEAMLYQLLMLTAHPGYSNDGYTIAKCNRCGKFFKRSSKRSKLCPECASPAARQRWSRANRLTEEGK